jgi:hypothetical protein
VWRKDPHAHYQSSTKEIETGDDQEIESISQQTAQLSLLVQTSDIFHREAVGE